MHQCRRAGFVRNSPAVVDEELGHHLVPVVDGVEPQGHGLCGKTRANDVLLGQNGQNLARNLVNTCENHVETLLSAAF